MHHPNSSKAMSAGRVLVIDCDSFENALAVLLKTTSSSGSNQKQFTVLVVCDKNTPQVQSKPSQKSTKPSKPPVRPVLPNRAFYRPEGASSQQVLVLSAHDITDVTNRTLKVNSDRIIDDVKKRQQPRFR